MIKKYKILIMVVLILSMITNSGCFIKRYIPLTAEYEQRIYTKRYKKCDTEFDMVLEEANAHIQRIIHILNTEDVKNYEAICLVKSSDIWKIDVSDEDNNILYSFLIRPI